MLWAGQHNPCPNSHDSRFDYDYNGRIKAAWLPKDIFGLDTACTEHSTGILDYPLWEHTAEWHPVNVTAGMIITRVNGMKDSIAFSGGIAYKGKIYTYAANRELVSILSKQLPYIDSLLWQVLIAPNDTIVRKKLDKEIMRLLNQVDSTKHL